MLASASPAAGAGAAAPPCYPDSLLSARRCGRCYSLADFFVPKVGVLGQGQFGQVLRVVERASKRQLVLKKLSKQALLDEGAVRQFQREVEIHSRLFHPHIVRMFAYFHDAESCYLLLELAELGSLYSRIQAGRLPELEAAVLFRQLASAVAHLHRRGVLHRDLKPENVFLGKGAGGHTVRRGGSRARAPPPPPPPPPPPHALTPPPPPTRPPSRPAFRWSSLGTLGGPL